MLKRSGCASDPAGISATQPGALAVECPACPHPGKNLPEWWAQPSPTSWIYTLYLAMDANFRLKLRQRGIKNDPELGPGWAYFVEDSHYKSTMETFGDQEEVSTNPYFNYVISC